MKHRVLFLCFCVCHFACTAQVIKQYTEEKTGQLVLTPSISVPFENDVQWWMENRGKDYYGMNAIDAAALINALRLQGNDKAELILTQNKGYRPDGTRHPHSWSIVDEQELVDWFAGLLE
ncbi:MAG: hypothetical protein R2828_11630 [Saprospiraceae bacterium]